MLWQLCSEHRYKTDMEIDADTSIDVGIDAGIGIDTVIDTGLDTDIDTDIVTDRHRQKKGKQRDSRTDGQTHTLRELCVGLNNTASLHEILRYHWSFFVCTCVCMGELV